MGLKRGHEIPKWGQFIKIGSYMKQMKIASVNSFFLIIESFLGVLISQIWRKWGKKYKSKVRLLLLVECHMKTLEFNILTESKFNNRIISKDTLIL